MKTQFLTLAAAAACLLTGAAAASAQDVDVRTLDARMTRGAYRPGQVIVKFKPTSSVAIEAPTTRPFRASAVTAVDVAFRQIGVDEVAELMPLTGARTFAAPARSFSGQPIEARPMARAYVLSLADGATADVHGAVQRLRELDDVEYAEPNYLVYSLALEDGDTPDDPYYSLQYGIEAINLPALWAQPVLKKEGPVIAILDTGVDISHPDLEANIWTNTAEAEGAANYDDDRNGFKDDVHGWDFVNQTGDIHDYNGHGTHCAGIAAACGFNGKGIVGANPDARIMPLTVLQSNGTGDVATIIKAIDYAAANGADIISMSLGSYSASLAMEEALGRAYQSAVIVAAAGNDGLCLNHAHPEKAQQDPMPMFPAAYTFVLGVQASAAGGGRASFSNYDDDGPTFSAHGALYNYELTAPGVSVMSTYPGGGYKELSGTSMATPLVAGAVSRLLQAKEYTNKDELFGDLIHTAQGNLDIFAAYRITDADRTPELQFVTIDMVDADGDGRADAGEEVAFYPVIRNTWGNVSGITFSVEGAEPVNNTFTILDGTVEFGVNLSSYGKARALNPVRIRFNDNVADGRIVRLKFTAQGNNAAPIEQELEVTVENVVELTGLLTEDMTLTPDQHYVVTGTFGVPQGRTLTIQPGTTIKFRAYSQFVVTGKVIADGQPGKMITFTHADHDLGPVTAPLDFGSNSVSYCIFDFNDMYSPGAYPIITTEASHCIYRIQRQILFSYGNQTWKYSSFENLSTLRIDDYWYVTYSNMTGFNNKAYIELSHKGRGIESCNIFNNRILDRDKKEHDYSFMVLGDLGEYIPDGPCYVGTSSVEIAKTRVIDMNHPLNGHLNTNTIGNSTVQYNFSNMPTRPYAEAPGIVWKVVVNGYDAQDEFDRLPPLGVGTHKFEVYFNRPMNKAVTPTVAMGVREPYTQTAIGENGSWNAAGDVYTAYLTLTGKSNIDGLNRIYVAGAEDDEFFPIPVEDRRFNVLVQAAGSLSAGFVAEAGLGRVNLTWDSPEDEDIDDMLGFNMYRYEVDAEGNASDAVCINRQLLEPQAEMALTDYDVVPRTTYCYYYRVMRTDMSETSPSRTVAVTPLAAAAGDANGSGSVDVADVITTVNYASGLEPKPFIFEAADMNADLAIDILDVVGIIRTILYPGAAASLAATEGATYFVDADGTVYVTTPVALAGVQLNLRLAKGGSVRGAEALDGFEQTGAWLGEEDYIFMAYSLSGRTLEPGTHAVAVIEGGDVADIRLSDVMGGNVTAERENIPTAVEEIAAPVRPAAPGIYTAAGVRVATDAEALERLPAGLYIVNGEKVVK